MVFSVLHPGVHFWHNRQSQGHNAQPWRGECKRIIQQYFRIFSSRWPTRQYRTRICFVGIMELSRFSPTCLSLMWPDRWWTSSSSCPRCPEHGRWWLFLWFYGHFNFTVGRDLLFCGQGRTERNSPRKYQAVCWNPDAGLSAADQLGAWDHTKA